MHVHVPRLVEVFLCCGFSFFDVVEVYLRLKLPMVQPCPVY